MTPVDCITCGCDAADGGLGFCGYSDFCEHEDKGLDCTSTNILPTWGAAA